MASTSWNNQLSTHPFHTEDSKLEPVYRKVTAGQRLEMPDIQALYRSTDLLAIGWLANSVRSRVAGNTVRLVVQQLVAANHGKGRVLRAAIEAPAFVPQPAADAANAAVLLRLREEYGDAGSISVANAVTDGENQFATTGMQEMKHIAIARLALSEAGHIRVFWEALGSKLCQIAIRFGASELDASFFGPDETIPARRREAERLIRAAGFEPQFVERPEQRVVEVS